MTVHQYQERRDLGNGAAALFVPSPDTPVAAVCITFASGSRHDTAGRFGIAHLFEHLNFAGTHMLGRGDMLRVVGDLGGLVNATTSADMTRYYALVPADRLPALLDLEYERFSNTIPALTEQVLEKEKLVVLAENQETVVDRAYGDAAQIVAGHVFAAASGYAHQPIGEAAGISAVSLSDCRSFHASRYAASHMSMTVVGNVDPEATQAAGKRLSAALAGPPGGGAALVPPPRRSTVRHVLRRGLRARVVAGLALPPAGSPLFEAARLAAYHLARGRASYLVRALVDGIGCATSVELKTMSRRDEASIGLIEMSPSAGVSVDELLGHLDAAMSAALACAPSPADIDRSVARYRAAWALDDDDMLARVKAIAQAWIMRDDPGAYYAGLCAFDGMDGDGLREAIALWDRRDERCEVVYA